MLLTFHNTCLSVIGKPFENSFTRLALIFTHSTHTNLVWNNFYWLLTLDFLTENTTWTFKISLSKQSLNLNNWWYEVKNDLSIWISIENLHCFKIHVLVHGVTLWSWIWRKEWCRNNLGLEKSMWYQISLLQFTSLTLPLQTFYCFFQPGSASLLSEDISFLLPKLLLLPSFKEKFASEII